MQQHLLLDRPLFAFSFPRAAYFGGPLENEGKLTIGAIDYDAYIPYHEVLRYNPIIFSSRYQGLWVVRGTINRVQSMMILDTGSSFIVLPLEMARMLFSRLDLRTEAVGSSLIALYPCADYPSIEITIGRSSIILHPNSMQFGPDNNGWCKLSVIGIEQEDVTLGRPFFENAYTVIDMRGRVGLC
ncbi:hypothetical protein V8E36_000092 [Tilletia maclaganii]